MVFVHSEENSRAAFPNAVTKSAVFRTVYLSVAGAPTGSANLPPTSETWISLGELPASHVGPLPARSIATAVLQGWLR